MATTKSPVFSLISHFPQIKNSFLDLFETHVLKLKVGND
ncbi:hypothetical protein ATHSA_1108 [Athalassotoga saccharophila]|nr:hypothetical protein ATHSA_1108 [Athalassotoga saccharophila]